MDEHVLSSILMCCGCSLRIAHSLFVFNSRSTPFPMRGVLRRSVSRPTFLLAFPVVLLLFPLRFFCRTCSALRRTRCRAWSIHKNRSGIIVLQFGRTPPPSSWKNLLHGRANGHTIRGTSEWTLWLRFRVSVRLAMEIVSCARGWLRQDFCCRTSRAPQPPPFSSKKSSLRQDHIYCIRSTSEWTLELWFPVNVVIPWRLFLAREERHTEHAAIQLEEIFSMARPLPQVSVAPASGRCGCGSLGVRLCHGDCFLRWRSDARSTPTSEGSDLLHGMATGKNIRSTSEWTLWLRFLLLLAMPWRLFLTRGDDSSSIKNFAAAPAVHHCEDAERRLYHDCDCGRHP